MTSMPNPPSSRKAHPDDRGAVLHTIVRAFAEDPLVRWFFPDDASYERRAGAFFGYLFDIRVVHGEIHVVDDCSAASLWNPPGGVRMQQMEQDRLWAAYVEPGAGIGELDRLDAMDETVHGLRPAAAHWYLGVLATDPSRRGGGLARAVMQPILERADADDMPAFLETGTPENLPFYARFGFDVLAEARVPGGPPLWVMWRPPSAAGARREAQGSQQSL
jgi:GNAT superfamily N-acetyltransferase